MWWWLVLCVVIIFSPILLILFPCIHFFSLGQYGRYRLLFAKSDNSKIPTQTGKVAIVTGGSSGLGYESCKELVRVGATCIVTARTQVKAEEIAKEINNLGYSGKAIGMELELNDHNSIYQFSQNFRDLNLPLHILLLNAGLMALPEYSETKDGIEMQVGVNFIGHYYLNSLLQDILEASQPSRVIIITSAAHEMVWRGLPTKYSVFSGQGIKDHYWPNWQYGASKLFNIYNVLEMDEKMKKEQKNVIFVAVMPGVVSTNLGRYSFKDDDPSSCIFTSISLTPNQGAVTQLYAATTSIDTAVKLSGKYMVPQARVKKPSSYATNSIARKMVIQQAEEIISKWEK